MENAIGMNGAGNQHNQGIVSFRFKPG